MKTYNLRNYTAEIVIGILSLALCLLLCYWGTKGDIILQISGAKLDAQTSSILFFVIAIGPLLTGINLLIKGISSKTMKEFAIKTDNSTLSFPVSKTFKGFKLQTINKSEITKVALSDRGKGIFDIHIFGNNNLLTGVIKGEFFSNKTIKPAELANEIVNWANS